MGAKAAPLGPADKEGGGILAESARAPPWRAGGGGQVDFMSTSLS